jgi:hypothetical protein
MIPARPLVAGFELVGRDELANVVAAYVVDHVDCFFIARNDAEFSSYFVFGDKFSPKFGPSWRVILSVNS